MSLTELPPELLEQILRYLKPDDFERFVLCNRVFYRCAASSGLLSLHNQRRRISRNFSYENSPSHKTGMQLLHAIDADPLLGEYFRSVDFRLESIEFDDIPDEAEWPHEDSEFLEFLSSSNILSPGVKDGLREVLALYDSSHFEENYGPQQERVLHTIILLSLMPNLEEITPPEDWELIYGPSEDVGGRPQPEDDFLRALWRLVEAVLSIGVNNIPFMENDTRPQRLKRVFPNTVSIFEQSRALDTLSLFMATRGVEEMHVCGCRCSADGMNGVPFFWKYPHVSNIRLLELAGCSIDVAGITQVVNHVPYLKILRYSHDLKWRDTLEYWDARAFIAAVGEHSGKNFEELAIAMEGLEYIENGVVSMKEFTALKKAELDVRIFTFYGKDQAPCLANVIPSGLRELVLCAIQQPAGANHIKLVDALLQMTPTEKAAMDNCRFTVRHSGTPDEGRRSNSSSNTPDQRLEPQTLYDFAMAFGAQYIGKEQPAWKKEYHRRFGDWPPF